MSFENQRPRSKRSSVETEEERAWVSFYRRVRTDVAIATEVLAQLEADPESRRAHLALYLCCKESLRMHKARQARNKRFGQFVRLLCHRLVIVPAQALRRLLSRSGDLVVECLPETTREPAVAQVRRLAKDPAFAPSAAAFGRSAASDDGVPTTPRTDGQAVPPARVEATRTA